MNADEGCSFGSSCVLIRVHPRFIPSFTSLRVSTETCRLGQERATVGLPAKIAPLLIVSGLFLASYLFYHYNVGSVRFTKQGWIRNVYFPLLLTHTVLAAVVLPMVLRTAFLAFKGRFPGHVRIARWTFPIWAYVSITGVVVYLMLYRL